MEPLISIALCTYNGANFLPQQLDSILNQTYKNIELVIVDDCSKDGTKAILTQYAERYESIKLHFNDQNIGFNANFQKAIAICSGDFIAISDQDDIWLENKLKLLHQNIGDNWLIFSNSEWIDEKENPIGRQTLNPDFKLGNRDYRSALFYNSVTGHTTLFSKTLLPYIFPIPETGYYDWWIGFVALYHHKITCLNEYLTLHRIHSSSVMHKFKGNVKTDIKAERFKEIDLNLSLVRNYKNLKEADKKLIKKIYAARRRKGFSPYLIRLIYKYYQDYFPDLKSRTGLSRLNFAIKFSKNF
ncbi:glycosyltransferase [Pedobacter terrae]|uniref:glycosyltransferase n=1 Tax=Pedobacter terrae TaxID=405671 RepID=UPI002FFCC630